MIAQFRGTCGWCYQSIIPGNHILLTAEWGWVHKDPLCERYRGTRRRVQEDDNGLHAKNETIVVKDTRKGNDNVETNAKAPHTRKVAPPRPLR